MSLRLDSRRHDEWHASLMLRAGLARKPSRPPSRHHGACRDPEGVIIVEGDIDPTKGFTYRSLLNVKVICPPCYYKGHPEESVDYTMGVEEAARAA